MQSDINYDVSEVEHGTVYKFINESENGTQIMLGVIFNKDNTDVDLQLHSPLGLTDAEKKEEVLDLINRLNNSYRYGKLILLDDSQVIMKDAIALLDEEADYSNLILQTLFILLQVAEVCFPPFAEFQAQTE